jgi:23S rRNA (uracil1939-C5)-methyltransferase
MGMSASRSSRSGNSPRRNSPQQARSLRAKKAKPRSTTPSYGPPVDVTIDYLGARGDGVAQWQDRPLFVPFALPGETVSASPGSKRADGVSARLEKVLSPAPERTEPPCPVFQKCGGCTLQHLERSAETAWKRGLIVDALQHRGFTQAETLVGPTQGIPQGTRRRVSLSYRRLQDSLIVGFNERSSHQIIPVDHCPLSVEALNSILAQCSQVFAPLLPKGAQGDLVLTATDSGVDAVIDLPARPDLDGYQDLAAAAEQLDLARLSIRLNGEVETLAQRRQPAVSFGGVTIPLPAGAFLQPSKEGEAALQSLVLDGLAGITGPVGDLFCGVGTFALVIAEKGHAVTAYDHLLMQTAPLNSTGRVHAQQRDLFRQPMLCEEVVGLSALVIDPPRAGASEQCGELMRLPETARLQRVIMVSCNPATFSRDARLLEDAGFILQKVTPVDQFIWSAHLEVVAIFDRMR